MPRLLGLHLPSKKTNFPIPWGCRTNVRQLILYIQHKTPSFEKPGVRGIISLCYFSELYKTYGRIRKNQVTPRQMLKLVIYAAMNRIYSSRDIRKAWKRAITKNQARLYTKLTSFVAECEELPFFERYGESLRI